MLPVIASIGLFTVTSFGLFTVIAFLTSLYICWRLAIVYDFDKEKILDLFILTCLVGLIGSRLSFVLVHLAQFRSLADMISIIHFPGFYFWGGFYASIIFLVLVLSRKQTSFWQVTDIAVVGLVAGLSLGSIGCLLSSCQYGFPSSWGVTQSGLIEPRFPIQIVLAVLFLLAYLTLWRQSLKFHLTGVITAKAMIWVSLIIFLTDFFRADQTHQWLYLFSFSQLMAVLTFVLGITIFCLITKTSPTALLTRFIHYLTNPHQRRRTFDSITDDISELPTQLSRTQNKLYRRFNIRRNPKSL